MGVAVASATVDRIGYRLVFLTCALALVVIGVVFAFSLRQRLPAAAAPGA
jgi:YNFM family putative membrane transporter